MGVIDEVKQRLDIVEVIGEYVPLAKAGRNFRALCPFHSEKHPSFYVYPEQQRWHCFGACSAGGDVFSFVMKKEGTDFGEVLRQLAQRAGVTIPSRSEPEAGKDERERLYQINAAAAQYFHNLLLNSAAGKKAQGYLTGRGLLPKTLQDFQLGFSPNSWQALKEYLVEKGYTEPEMVTAGLIVKAEAGGTHDRFRNKLMFPIFDARGRVNGFGARVLDDSSPKYVNSPQTPVFDKSGTLYGINLASRAIRQQDLVVIVEGYMDVLTAYQNGFDNVVASMGVAITDKQVNVLKKLTRSITLALDADTAGEEAMLRCVGYENTIGNEIKVTILPGGKDPDDVIREDATTWQNLLEHALPIVDYTFDMVASKLDLTTAKGKTLAVGRLLPIVAEIEDPVRQTHYLQKLASLVRVSERNLELSLKRARPGPVRRRVDVSEPVTRMLRPMLSSPKEEYCLALLLQYPKLKNDRQVLAPEYFQNTENREIFITWQQASDPASLKEKLDPAMHDYLDSLATRAILSTQIERRFAECALGLREEFLRSLEARRGEVFALEAEAGGESNELARLEEEGVENSRQLGEVFAQRRQARSGRKEVSR